MAYGVTTIEYPVTHASIFKVLTDRYNLDSAQITNSISGTINMSSVKTHVSSGPDIKAFDIFDLRNVARKHSSDLATKLYNAAARYFSHYIETQHNIIAELTKLIKSHGFRLDVSTYDIEVDDLAINRPVAMVDFSGTIKAPASIESCINSCAKLLIDAGLTIKSDSYNSAGVDTYTITAGQFNHITLLYIQHNINSNECTGYISIDNILDQLSENK